MSAIQVRATVAARGVDIDIELASRKCTAIIGPNGAGKSTLIELISGLLKPSSGTVRIGSKTVADSGVFVPAHRRDIGLLAQDPLLFPHLNVLDNVAFGLRARGVAREEARETALKKLQRLGSAALAPNRASEVSGGQAQRIGLARALVTEPRVLLLDEPLAALDAVTAPQMRELLRENLTDRTTALVTHDLLDVLVLADHLAVLNEGRVVAHGPTHEILAQPRDEFLAEFLGVNVLGGELEGAQLKLGHGMVLRGISPREGEKGAGWASFPATAITVHRSAPAGSARNVLEAVVTAIKPRGPIVRVVCDLAGQQVAADVTSQAVAQLEIEVEARVFLAIKATAVALY